jgi:hypothetical protein
MIDYMGVMLADLKVEEMRRSMTPIEDYDPQIVLEMPSWVAQCIGRLLLVVGGRMTTLGERMDHERDMARGASLKGHQKGTFG